MSAVGQIRPRRSRGPARPDFLRKGAGCCMSYVGPQYGNGFRLAIVGIDHSDFAPATFEERQREMLDMYIKERKTERKNFNQNYAEVVKMAAAVLGKSTDHCLTACTKTCETKNNEDCVLNRITQPNLVKCVPQMAENMTSRATWTMKVKCARHLVSELRILRPEMIIFHGVQSRRIMRPEFERVGVDLDAIEECADSHSPVLYRSAELGAHILFLYHPSHGWLDRQWSQVERWIGYLRERALIPE
jgi:hypothetical protein